MAPLRDKTNGFLPSSSYSIQHRSAAIRTNPLLVNVYSRSVQKSQPSPKSTTRNDTHDKELRALFLENNIDVSNSLKLGSGRYSKVVTARMLPSGFKIAIKIINKSKVTPDFREKFLPREIDCWKRLNHPNLVRILGHFEALNCVFLTMEYGSGGDLLSYVQKNGAMTECKAGEWIIQILSGISYMHSIGIAHRDLKLENIIVFTDNFIKITDFGFSRMISPNLSTTFCGSKSYSAPEILLGEPYNPFKSDIWSIGVIAYVMVTDHMPFNEKQQNNIIVEAQRNRTYSYDPNLKLSQHCRYTIDYMLTFSWKDRPDITRCVYSPWFWKIISEKFQANQLPNSGSQQNSSH